MSFILTRRSKARRIAKDQPVLQLNPQTRTLCEKLGVDDPLGILLKGVSSDNTSSSWSLPGFLTPDRTISTTKESEDTSQLFDSSSEDISQLINNISKGSPSVKRMSLPPPKLVLPDEEPEDFISLSMDSQTISQQSSIPSEDSQLTSEDFSETTAISKHEGSEPLRLHKKFKRRNESLYSSIEND